MNRALSLFALIVAAVLGLGMGEGEAVTNNKITVLFPGKKATPVVSGGLLLVNGTNPVYLVNGSSGLCLAIGGC